MEGRWITPELLADAQREASKRMSELVDGYLHGKEPVLVVHDEVATVCQAAWDAAGKAPAYPDPSAERDARATARVGGFAKPVNRPHKDEKPANPYPPAHPKAQPPAGLLAVSDMSARMGNRWSA